MRALLLCFLVTVNDFLMRKSVSRSGHCQSFVQTWSSLCEYLTPARRLEPVTPTCDSGMTVLDAAEASPWQRSACRTLVCAKEPPGSPPKCRGSPGVPGCFIVSAMINYRPDEMWRLWKCHKDDMGLSVWASREERIAHRHLEGYGAPAARCLFKERTSYYLSWYLLELCNTVFTYSIISVHWQTEPGYQADVFYCLLTDEMKCIDN